MTGSGLCVREVLGDHCTGKQCQKHFSEPWMNITKLLSWSRKIYHFVFGWQCWAQNWKSHMRVVSAGHWTTSFIFNRYKLGNSRHMPSQGNQGSRPAGQIHKVLFLNERWLQWILEGSLCSIQPLLYLILLENTQLSISVGNYGDQFRPSFIQKINWMPAHIKCGKVSDFCTQRR